MIWNFMTRADDQLNHHYSNLCSASDLNAVTVIPMPEIWGAAFSGKYAVKHCRKGFALTLQKG